MALKSIYLSIKKDKFFQRIYWLLVGTIITINSSIAISKAQANSVSIDSSINKQPLVVRGTSGGTIIAQEITQIENTATGYCDGYVSSQPNHILKLESFFESLRLEVESSADTTILVKGPGGVWCNDDAGSANPMIKGQWQPGTYQVWIGSYQANSNDRYRIKISGK